MQNPCKQVGLIKRRLFTYKPIANQVDTPFHKVVVIFCSVSFCVTMFIQDWPVHPPIQGRQSRPGRSGNCRINNYFVELKIFHTCYCERELTRRTSYARIHNCENNEPSDEQFSPS